MEYLISFFEYGKTVLINWWVLFMAVVFAIDKGFNYFFPPYAKWFNEHVMTTHRRWKWFVVGGIMFSGFLAWASDHKQLGQVSTQLKTSEDSLREEKDGHQKSEAALSDCKANIDSPVLTSQFNQFIYGGTVATKGTFEKARKNPVLIQATITNGGKLPTIIRGWHLYALFDDGQAAEGYPLTFPSWLTVTNKSNTMSATLYKEDSLYEKGLKAIQPGEMIRGNMYFTFPDVEEGFFKDHLVAFTLQFHDSQDKPHQVTYELKDCPSDEILSIPGIKMDMKQDNKKVY